MKESRVSDEEISHVGQKLKSERERVRHSLTSGNNGNEDNTLDLNAVENVVDPNNHNTNDFQNHGSMLLVVPITIQFPAKKSAADEFSLNREQRAAFMLITRHLDGDSRSRTDTCVEFTPVD